MVLFSIEFVYAWFLAAWLCRLLYVVLASGLACQNTSQGHCRASWFHNRPHYLTEQREINAKMRAILVDWLVEARWLQDAAG